MLVTNHARYLERINTMAMKIKTRNCKRKVCLSPYEPKTEWQKYCSDKCRDAVANEKKLKILREYRRGRGGEAQGKGAA